MVRIAVEQHVLVPKHIRMSKEEAEEVLRTYNAKPKNFPRILRNDPAIREMDVVPGDMIKIVRESPTGGLSVAYRIVE